MRHVMRMYANRMSRPLVWGALGLALLVPVRSVSAHNLDVTQAFVVFKTDGTYLIDIRAHLDALALGRPGDTPQSELNEIFRAMSPEELDKTVEDLKDMLSGRIHIRFDDIRRRPAPTFPEFRTALAATSDEPSVLGATIRLEGRVPKNAATFTISLSRAFGNMTQMTIIEEGTGIVEKPLLGQGDDSPPFVFGGDPSKAGAGAEDGRTVFGRFIIQGFEHIIPKGIDHILFVLGLFLLSTHLRPLLWQISAFTVAHTITLALAMTGVFSLPPHIVEPLIALSIAYVAIENIATPKMKPWRPFVVFAFGLLHGMGFAGVLMELGLPRGQFASALVGFNVGVEIGQLSVVALAFLAVGWFRRKEWYRAAIIIPQSLAIAAVGLYWTVERIASGA